MTEHLNGDLIGGGASEADAVARITAAGTEPVIIDVDQLHVFRNVDGDIRIVDPMDYYDTPRAYRDLNVKAYNTESFIEAVKQLGASQARVYADPAKFTAVAILNDDSADYPGRRNRRITMQCTNTPQWNAWLGSDDTLMSQVLFAQFIEDHVEDISSLSGADLLEISQSIEATKSTTFKSAQRLSNGQRKFTHDEAIAASAGVDGDLEIPDSFEITVSPWVGFDATPYKVTAKLRYRIESTLKLGYHLVGAQQILDSAFLTDVVNPIRSAELWTVLGTP